MTSNICREIFLTFDVEDFINRRSIKSLNRILETLRKYGLQGLFFITGHMAEKLACCKETLELFADQQIGYHSSSHSVRPTILEYTDVSDYAAARLESIRRECSHINPLTGKIEGTGGITFLRELFPDHRIKAFRAPDYCWSPPHLQALADLDIIYDFSTKLFPEPATFKGITFYPYPICHYWIGRKVIISLLRAIPRNRTIVLNFHDWHFVNKRVWNNGYKHENPEKLIPAIPRSQEEIRRLFSLFEWFLSNINAMQRTGLIKVTADLKSQTVNPSIDRDSVTKQCSELVAWCKRNYYYKPKFLRKHFEKFFFES
jgi:hypothetical protein